MDWKKIIGNAAPTIGAVFGAPGIAVGTAIRSILNMPENSSDDEVRQKAESPEGQEKIRLAEIAWKKALLEAGTAQVVAVNQTMQAESKSEHWAQWAWRPFNGFAFGITLFCNYALPALVNCLILPFFKETHQPLTSGTIPPEAFMAWGAMLGITAWHRGVMKTKKINSN